MIKWISLVEDSGHVDEILNKYYKVMIAESLSIVSHGIFNDIPYCQVTFLLNQTFNNEEELNQYINTEQLF